MSQLPAHGRSGSPSPDVTARSLQRGQASYVLPEIATGATPRPDVMPGQLVFQFPAHRGFVSHIWSALEATLAVIDRCPATGRDLEAALFAVATAIITQARPWTPLEVSIAVDDTDAFVRLSAELLDPDEPAQLGEHVRATLRRNVESHDLLHEGRNVLAVLQVPLEPLPSM